MKTLYATDYEAPKTCVYWGYIVKGIDEEINDAVESYLIGKYSETLEDAKDSATGCEYEYYHVCVTYVDDDLIKILGERCE